MLAICILFCSCLCTVSSKVSDSLMIAMRILFCSCLSTVCSKVSDSLVLAIRILFCSCLCSLLKGFRLSCLPCAFCFVPAYVQFAQWFQTLILAICILFCSCLSTVCSMVSDSLMLAVCVVLFLPIHSLLKGFRLSRACHTHPVLFLPMQFAQRFQTLVLAMCILFCSCLCTVCSMVSDSHTCHMHSVLFLPIHSLLNGFRLSHACRMRCFVPAYAQFAQRFQTLSCLPYAFCFACSYLCTVCSKVSDSHACHTHSVLFLPMHSLLKVSDSLMLAMHILFCSCLCTVCSKVSDSLMVAMRIVLFLPMQSSLMSF